MADFYDILSCALFAVALTLSLLVGVSGYAWHDRAMIFIMMSYTLSFGIELPFLDGKWMPVLKPLNGTLSQALLYFFVFEMLRLMVKLRSGSFHEHLEKRKRLTWLKWAVFLVLFLADVILGLLYRVFKVESPETISLNLALFDSFVLMRSLAKLALDLLMVSIFILVFRYLLDRKRED